MKKIKLADQKSAEKKLIVDLGPAQKRRLNRIDLLLAWDGSFGRSDLTGFFGISEQQASADIAKYRDIAPDNSQYKTKDKTYYVTDSFKSALVDLSADRYLDQLQGLHSGVIEAEQTWFRQEPSFDAIPAFRPDVSNQILMKILQAIRLNCGIQIKYQPLTRAKKSTPWIAPHAIAFSGRRWHVRAWSFKRQEFRDFVLTRIDEVSEFSEIEFGDDEAQIADTDDDWNEFISIKIVPCKILPDQQKRVIAKDFGMPISGKLVKVRKALILYFVDWHRLDPIRYRHISENERMIEADDWSQIKPYMPPERTKSPRKSR